MVFRFVHFHRLALLLWALTLHFSASLSTAARVSGKKLNTHTFARSSRDRRLGTCDSCGRRSPGYIFYRARLSLSLSSSSDDILCILINARIPIAAHPPPYIRLSDAVCVVDYYSCATRAILRKLAQ